MAKKDYYEILGVAKDAPQNDIKKRYRALSKKHHPDKGGDEEKFKEISEAYNVLGDEEKRKKYDQMGQGYPGMPGDNGFGGNVNMQDAYAEFFRQRGGFGNPNAPQKGTDLRTKVVLTLQEIFSGTVKKFKYKKEVTCSHCGGTGAASSSSVHKCATCNGSGFTRKVRNTILGTSVIEQTCSDCGGSGQVVDAFCKFCNGSKVEHKEESIELNIPRSVKTGDVVSFAGYGNASKNGGPSGNLYVIIEESDEDAAYRNLFRQESSLFSKHSISIYDAIFGKELEVEAIDGRLKVNIPHGTQSGSRFRVEGKGLFRPNSNDRGDMYIDISVYIPQTLTSQEKEIFEKIKDSENIKPKR